MSQNKGKKSSKSPKAELKAPITKTSVLNKRLALNHNENLVTR